MSGANSKSLPKPSSFIPGSSDFNPLPGTPNKDPVQLLKDLDNRSNPDHTAENADQAAKDKAASDAANNVTGNTPKTAQFATRAQIGDARAAAAGSQRSGNDADLLGYTSTTKKRSASRQILG